MILGGPVNTCACHGEVIIDETGHGESNKITSSMAMDSHLFKANIILTIQSIIHSSDIDHIVYLLSPPLAPILSLQNDDKLACQ